MEKKDQTKKRKQDLGIFYTPQEVVDFIFDMLNIWKNKEDKEKHRWQTRKPRPHYPSVIDPACGEGIFLKTAVTSGFTGYHPTEKTPYVFGVDIDGEVVDQWEEISILHDLFKGNKTKMLNHFHQQDGLLELPDKVFNYKTGGLKEFDAVVGNPPYGGMGFSSLKEKSTAESIQILEHLKKYEILSYRKRKNGNDNGQTPLWGGALWGTMTWGGGSSMPTNKEVESISIEILFLDRFIQLAKPGGWIGIIIPDGILTNSNSHYVREFISNRTKVEAIVSLPRETFKNAGTSAKTSILFLRKFNKDEKPEKSYPVFLVSAEKVDKGVFNKIVNSYEKIYNSTVKHMDKSNLIQTTKDQNKKEVVMIRVDKTLKDLMEEKPSSRWDPEFWHSDSQELLETLSKNFRIDTLGDHISMITYGQVGQRVYSKTGGVRYIQTINITDTGVNYWVKEAFIDEGSHNDPQRSRLVYEDLLLGNAGMGGLGKVTIFLDKDNKVNISQDIDLIRFEKINIYYVAVFLKSIYGQKQIWLRSRGVGAPKLPFGEIKEIKIPLLPTNIQTNIESIYKKVAGFHERAMEAKINKNLQLFKSNIDKAQLILKDLIKKTEEVIEGKRKDVI